MLSCVSYWSSSFGLEPFTDCHNSGYSFTQVNAAVFWDGVLSCVQGVTTTATVVAYSTNNVPVATDVGTPISWWAYSVQVRYQATDAAVLSAAASVTVGVLASPGGSITSTSLSSSSSVTSAPAHSGGSSSSISTGAIIGIAVGCGVGAFMFLAGIVLLCCTKRRNRKARQAAPTAMNAEPQTAEKRQDVVSWQTADSTQTHSFQNYPPNSILVMEQGGQYIQVPAELAAGGSTVVPNHMQATELPGNTHHYQHNSQTPIPYSTPSPSQTNTSQGYTSQSPNFFQQQQRFSQ
jgi:hypothetical protein